MPKIWGDFMFSQLEKDEFVSKTETDKAVSEYREKLDEITAKTQRLFDLYLDGDIDRENYQERRTELMSKKKSFEYKMERVLTQADFWIEPMRNWVKKRNFTL
jgi:uncharacterized coiled-coil DUF342 family protein